MYDTYNIVTGLPQLNDEHQSKKKLNVEFRKSISSAIAV